MSDVEVARQERLDQYEERTKVLMVSLALAYIAVYAVEVLNTRLSETANTVLFWVANAIWVTFVIDLILRTYLSPRRLDYLLRHPIDVIACVLPAFRALRVLRVFTAGQWLMTDGKRLTYGRTGVAIVAAVLMIVSLGSLAMLDAEKDAAGASITTFGQGLWFAFETITTVGYGDATPVTFQGRMVAVGLMFLGVSMLGIVSATLATGFLTRIRGEQEDNTTLLLTKLDSLETQVAALTAALGETTTRGAAG